MKFPSLKQYFLFTKSQRNGLFFLFSIIVILQWAYYFADFTNHENDSPAKQQWLSVQTEMDSLKKQQADYVPKMYPFNPNFITDFKGYKLGMSVSEIDRLLAFRKENKYVNSAKEFQVVTKISDSLLNAISPYFKFPDWINNKKLASAKPNFEKKEKITEIDINQATKEDLIKIYGIGDALSERILKQKELLGGFVNMGQMNDVWGLSPEVVENLDKYFKISVVPNVKKIAINKLSVRELSQFPYFRYPLSKEIVTYRSMNGDIRNAADLIKIKGFPVEKVDIIAVYLEF
ncbi:MAG TPA: helix-hairpin-helix domain-containing protein [Flavobacterium sp.]|nr:helix-hairpin-helix domain-containing protein [Flavobacterium sp.]